MISISCSWSIESSFPCLCRSYKYKPSMLFFLPFGLAFREEPKYLPCSFHTRKSAGFQWKLSRGGSGGGGSPRPRLSKRIFDKQARPAPSTRSGARLYVRFAAWDMAVRHHPWGISICARGRACPVYRPAPASRAHPISPDRTARTAPRLSRQALWLCPWWRADRRVRSTLS